VVSPARAARVLTRNGSTRKVTECAFIARNESNRVARVAAQWKITLGCRIHMDEAHRVGLAAERRWAWSLRRDREELYAASSTGIRKSFFVGMANDRLLDWLITRRPPGQTSVDCFVFLNNFVLPQMRSVEADREGGDQPDRCVLVLDNTCIHSEVALASLRAAGVVASSPTILTRLQPH